MKLAIKGHPTRGKEVIKLLEMMGGANPFSSNSEVIGNKESNCYYISENTNTKYISWDYIGPEEISEYKIFTLEEFLKKYPFKVGDKVVYTKFGDNCDDCPVTIESMKWTGTTIEYIFNDCVTCLVKDLKMWNGEPDAVISGIYLNSYDYADEVELNLGDYEIEVRDGRTFAVKKKPKYPKTYEECREIMQVAHSIIWFEYDDISSISNEGDAYEKRIENTLLVLRKLKICRDAYWKIAGEELGLGKSWKPNSTQDSESKYSMLFANCVSITVSRILAFPTEEMRDAFYENFKELIEQCKELL